MCPSLSHSMNRIIVEVSVVAVSLKDMSLVFSLTQLRRVSIAFA